MLSGEQSPTNENRLLREAKAPQQNDLGGKRQALGDITASMAPHTAALRWKVGVVVSISSTALVLQATKDDFNSMREPSDGSHVSTASRLTTETFDSGYGTTAFAPHDASMPSTSKVDMVRAHHDSAEIFFNEAHLYSWPICKHCRACERNCRDRRHQWM